MAADTGGTRERVSMTLGSGDGVVRKRFRIPGDKFCAVCGDKALAHHFAVLACESCKAFFRRNAFRQKELKPCTLKNRCQIDKDKRRSCPSCRLAKCFDVGMKPELIYDEEQKRDLKEKVKRSKQERRSLQSSVPTKSMAEQSHVSSTDIGITSPEMASTPEADHGQGNNSQNYVDISSSGKHFVVDHKIVDKSLQIATNSKVSMESDMNMPLKQLTMSSTKEVCKQNGFLKGMGEDRIVPMESDMNMSLKQLTMSSTKEVCKQNGFLKGMGEDRIVPSQAAHWAEQAKPLTSDVSSLTRAELPSDPHMYRRLSQEERTLLSQLSSGYEDTILTNLRDRRNLQKLDSSNYTVGDSLSDYEKMVHHATDFTKRLDDFQMLDFDDRIACFKASVDAFNIVYNTYVFVAERTSWLMLKGEVSYNLLMTLFPDYPFMDWRTDHCRGMKALAKNDVTIYSLFHCILLFNPSGDKISNRQLVSNLREKYTVLLRHYVEATFSYLYSEQYFKELQSKIVEIQDMCKADRKHAAETNCHLEEEFLPFELLQELHREDK